MTQVLPQVSTAPVAASPPDVLPDLYRDLLDSTGGTAAVVLQQNAGWGGYVASSSWGIPDATGDWLKDGEAVELFARLKAAPAIIDPSSVPGLARRTDAKTALAVSLSPTRYPALLLVVAPTASADAALQAGARARIDFAIVLELARLARESAFHQRIRDLTLAFSRGITSAMDLGVALEALCDKFNTLVGTRRTSVWVHNRRARELALGGSSDPVHVAAAARVGVDDPRAPAARGLRLELPQLLTERAEPVLIAPLRGWRRALGTIVIEGASAALDRQQMSEAVDALARHLAVAIENVQLLDEIQRQRRLLEDTFNSLIDPVVVVDTRVRVVQINDAFASRVGGSRHALLDRTLTELLGTELAAWAAAPLEPDDNRTRAAQFSDEVLGGTFAVTLMPLINQDGDPVGRVLVARDITEQNRLEAERTGLRERLAQSERLASLGQFVAGIAHEINNPLQGVLGHLELLIETSVEARPLRATLRRIYHEADRAAKIVRNLLVFTGSRRIARRTVRLDRVISRAIASRSAGARRAGIQVVRRYQAGLPRVSADPVLLQQAFINVLINAEHAIASAGGAGRIVVQVSSNAGGRITATIHDSGTGIAAEALPRLFDPFFTTKDVGKGTGLGLAITYGIIQEHGGTVRAANAPDGGAVITIELPTVSA
jgi:PAS domain S-box-containing protein